METADCNGPPFFFSIQLFGFKADYVYLAGKNCGLFEKNVSGTVHS